MPIKSFRGQHAFLSNFYNSPIESKGILYPTAEHAFQAAKCTSRRARKRIAQQPTPKKAKQLGNKIELRHDWEEVKVDIMKNVVRQKFAQNRNLIHMLIATHPNGLIEENNWGDRFWGTVNEQGHNWLGIILMEVRREHMKPYTGKKKK